MIPSKINVHCPKQTIVSKNAVFNGKSRIIGENE